MSIKSGILKVMGGEHVAALATVQEGKPAVRFLAMVGMDDLTLIGATMKSSRKAAQIKKNPAVALTIWSGKNYTDPFVMIQGEASVHDDLETKTKFWDKKLEPYFQKPENPEYVVLKFIPQRIEYYHDMNMEVWEK
jgi:general stress protein 26